MRPVERGSVPVMAARVLVTACVVARLVFATGCVAPAKAPPLVLVTTSSVENSGLLATLVPAFETHAGVRVQVHVAGSGRALIMLGDGDADVAISHAPAAEAATLARHPAFFHRRVMFNDFVIAGPAGDPAGIRSAPTAAEAFRRIAGAGALFLSRGDRSGTHEREESLWSSAGVKPAPDRVKMSGQGMSRTLRVAGETGAYTLTDRPTFAQLANEIPLVLLHEGDPALINTYSVLANPARHDTGRIALDFATWLSEGEGRRLIAEFRVPGHGPAYTLLPVPRQP